MGEMMGMIAHQWRQPLNVISLLVQDLKESYVYGGFSPEYLDSTIGRIMDSIQNMSHAMEDFSDFLKTETLESTFTLGRCIQRCRAILEPKLKHNRIAFSVEMEEELSLTGYPNEYVHLLMNIILSCIERFGKRSAENPKIAIRGSKEGERNIIILTDNAGPLSDKARSAIFGSAFPVSEGEEIAASLFLARIMVEKRMGGKLTVREVENGTEFRMEV
jgi:signal transduction histidine kinase